jgi:virulence-associated protein VagC
MKPIRDAVVTRVFKAGNSQAVRIPKAFELEAGEVVIERRGAGLFINPKRGRWDLFFDQPGIEVDFGELRHGGTPRDVNLELDSEET